MRLKVPGPIRLVAINALVLAAVLVTLEGLASAVLIIRDVAVLAWVAEPYTRYDPDLGWVNRSSVRLPDMFGPGVGVQTNAQGFRAADDVAPNVAPGRYRVICSGDSFTFGDGVDNDHTWCQQLAARDPRVEPVNLGEGGYGADQAYLRFRRDARGLQHRAHLFAFITDDFLRMQTATFLGFGKPVLAVEHGTLVVRNTPVPRFASRFPWLMAIPRAINDTRLAALVRRAGTKVRPEDPAAQAERDAATRTVLAALIAELKRSSDAQSSALILVYLPTIYELGGTGPTLWTTFIAQIGQQLHVPVINVLDDFRSRSDARQLFLFEGHSAGHYSNAGHAAVADIISRGLAPHLPQK